MRESLKQPTSKNWLMANSISNENSYLIEEKAPVFEQKGEKNEMKILLSAIFKKSYTLDALKNQNLQPEQTSNNPRQGFLKLPPVIPAMLQLQDPFSPSPNQTPGHQEKHLPNRLHHGLDFLPVQNLFLKPVFVSCRHFEACFSPMKSAKSLIFHKAVGKLSKIPVGMRILILYLSLLQKSQKRISKNLFRRNLRVSGTGF